MHLINELDDLVTELCRGHPRFPRVTVARLVARTAESCRRSRPGATAEALLSVVREAAAEQLRYADTQPG